MRWLHRPFGTRRHHWYPLPKPDHPHRFGEGTAEEWDGSGWVPLEELPRGRGRRTDVTDLYHNCVVHPICGLLWAFGPKRSGWCWKWWWWTGRIKRHSTSGQCVYCGRHVTPRRLQAFADRWHDRTAPPLDYWDVR